MSGTEGSRGWRLLLGAVVAMGVVGVGLFLVLAGDPSSAPPPTEDGVRLPDRRPIEEPSLSTPPTERAPSTTSEIWRAGMETGDVSEWWGVTVSATADHKVVSSPVHTGGRALALTVRNADGSEQPGPGVRMRVEKTDISPSDEAAPDNLPDEAYYSVWYYFPDKFEPRSNIFQWKRAAKDAEDHQTRQLLYSVRAEWDDDTDSFMFTLRDKVGSDDTMRDRTDELAASPLRFETDTWVHLECFYRWSTTPDGRITCWQDGEQIWDVSGLITEYDMPYLARPRQWTVNNYVGETEPRSHTIYIDNAAISLERIGPDGQ